MRVVAIADSDSYVKWAASLLGTLPPEWERKLLVVESQFVVNDKQLQSALEESGIATGERIGHLRVTQRLRELAPDAVLVAAPGPVTMIMIRMVAEVRPRPVVVSGLPGISIPVTVKALRFRRQSDLMIVHSHREVREFGELSAAQGWNHRLGLARLPFASDRPARGTDLVFAAQAVVPRAREDRLRVAATMRDAALADPSKRVVIKLRARAGERSTHPESDAYPDLVRELGPVPRNLVFTTGAMSAALDTAEGFVTVSSTAALEAIARGIPIIALNTFGVADELINPVFVGSGVLAGEAAVIGREFIHPHEKWFADNYFHDPAEDDLVGQLRHLVAARKSGRLPARPTDKRLGGRLRLAWDRRRAFGESDRSIAGAIALVIGLPARRVLILARRAARQR